MEYEVLYYKRTNKVHKSKGVSKLDGILVVRPEEGSVILRRSAEEEVEGNSSSEDEGRQNCKNNKKPNTKKKSFGVGILCSERNSALAREILVEGQVVVLGGFEAEIVRCGTTVNPADKVAGLLKPLKSSKLQNTEPSKTTDMRSNSLIKLLPQKRKPPNLLSRSLPAQPIVRGPFQLPQNRIPRQPSTVGLGQISQRLLSCKPSVRENDHTKEQVEKATPTTTSTTKKQRASPKQSTKATVTLSKPTTISQSADILPHIPLTALIRSKLRPHQISGIDFLWRCINGNLKGGLLADEMGLGKTLMTVAIISALHKQKRSAGYVVVCPSSLVANWAKEFDKWLGKAGQPKRVEISKGGEEAQKEIRSFCSGMKHNLSHQVGQVLIVSYDLLRLNVDTFRGIQEGSITLLVCDEAHRLKNTAGSLTLRALDSLSTETRICLSATPIQNNLSEFFNIANFVCPGVLGDLQSFRKNFDRPISAANNKTATREQRDFASTQSEALDKIVKTFMLRRLQKEVLTHILPPRSEILLFCKPSSEQCELYRRKAKLSTGGDATEILTALTGLRKICIHPNLGNVDNDCSLISHGLHLSGKLKVLADLLLSIREKAPEEKVVVVSNFTSALNVIESLILKPNNLTFVRLDGATDIKTRQTMVDTFNMTSTERSFCFLLSAKAGGCGLNLVGANRLIMVDPDWNPATDTQCMGRIYRQGQTKETVIYRLFTSGTVEEVIYQRQIHKGNLASVTVDGQRGISSNFSKEEMQDCLELKESACDTKTKIGKKWPEYNGEAVLLSCGDEPLRLVFERSSMELGYIYFVDPDEVSDVPGTPDPPHQTYDTSEDDESEEEF